MDILTVTRPEDLFPPNPAQAKTIYLEYAKKYHPDRNGGDDTAFKHMKALYEEYVRKIESGAWEGRGTLILKKRLGGKTKEVHYLFSRKFELGRFYVGNEEVVYVVDDAHEFLFMHGLASVQSFAFSSPRMKVEVEKYLPRLPEGWLCDGKYAMHMEKEGQLFLLRDVHNHYKGHVDPKHVAWILSSLHNTLCYFSYENRVHQDLSLDTCFVCPPGHYVAVLGGWWYCQGRGRSVKQLPKRTFDVLPEKAKRGKVATRLTDQELLKKLGRELIGAETPRKMRELGVPDPMANWLCWPANDGDPVAMYGKWMEVLTKSFGARRYHKMDVGYADLYGKGPITFK